MICPLCGYQQPDYASECLQCHTRFEESSSDEAAAKHSEEAEKTDTIIRVERRRKARARGEGTVNRERVVVRRPEPPDPSVSDDSPQPVKRPPQIQPPPHVIPPPVIGKPAAPPAVFRPPVASRVDDSERLPDVSLPPAGRAGDLNRGGDAPLTLDRTPSQSGEQLNQIVNRLKRVIVSTTPEVQGRPVKEYKGVVSTGAVVKLEGWSSYLEGVKDIGSLRHAPFDAQIRKARDVLITDLKIEAAKLGANGVVGMSVQLHPVQGGTDRLLWLVAIGTAVVLPE
ncbi:MAG: YbjQ family protein [Nitrospirae bacterium]|nr:YbjQ family protein [Nitrospirota bacterium]